MNFPEAFKMALKCVDFQGRNDELKKSVKSRADDHGE